MTQPQTDLFGKSESGPNSYDEVPYPAHANRWSHPDHLATLARLFGLESPSVDRCRVLELGCSNGGNILPMAQVLPDSKFVGIDLSQREIEDGLATIKEVGLSNVELLHKSILDVDGDFGQFDYIICHGVYSWVPPEVQRKILQICSENLAPNGVAYVSYNVYPGWHMRGMVRDMMCFHARRFNEPQERIQQARALIDFLSKAAPSEQDPFGQLMRRELAVLQQQPDSYLYHEHLEDINDPIYFHEFAERAETAGLQYLSEAQLSSMITSNLPEETAAILQQLSPDLIHMEQYMDFVRQRQFRSTLLCHQGLNLNRKIRAQHLTGLYVAAPTRPVDGSVNLHSNEATEFEGLPGWSLNTADPLMKAALVCLGEAWPRAVPTDQLLAQTHARLQTVMVLDAERYEQESLAIGNMLLDCLASGMIELRINPSRFTTEVGDRPLVTPLVRFQAKLNRPVTSLRHDNVHPSDFNRKLLFLLDGTHGRESLVEILTQQVMDGSLMVSKDGRQIQDYASAHAVLDQLVQTNLEALAGDGLLSLWSQPLGI